MQLTVSDATFAGDITNTIKLHFATESVSVRDIITERVVQEVERYNAAKEQGAFNGLVQPLDAELRLNGERPVRTIDAEKQVYVALDAFLQNGYFVLVDDVQAGSLDQRVELRHDTEVSFVRLTPLVGG